MNARALMIFSALLLAAGLHAADTNQVRLTPVQRMQPAHLKATHEAVQRFARERVALPDLGAREDFRAVIHVHAEDSDHTKGTRPEVLAAAKKTGVRAVLFTDHRGPKTNTWHEMRDGVLFLAGSEGFAGMEIVNRHSDAILDKSAQEYLIKTSQDPEQWQQLVKLLETYPDALFGAGCDYRAEIMAKWDRETQKQPLTGIAANDAHQNVQIKGTTFDPYEVSFRNLCTHLLATNLTEPALRAALRGGHAYVSHDWLCDPTGFTFGAVNNLGVFSMGDSAPMQGTTRVMGLTPLPALLKLFHHGQVVAQTNGTNLTFRAKKPGAYRLEAWLDVAGELRPWIYSNPVYLKEQSILDTPMPNFVAATNVEVKKDLVYFEGKPEDAAKHKLDLYVPKGTASAPVFVFLHGGAWRFGDRGLYPPLGHRFAKEGILTVIPSYRLAPQNPWPAQAEDCAAALAWTVRRVAEFGGDTNRVFIGGHSAGGHLSSLLTFNERYLQPHGMSASIIRGVIALSGVYNLDIGDVQSTVFGKDRTVRQDASPLFQVMAPGPPFLVTYCEWDYPTLPAQAKLFHAALRRAGIVSDLFFTRGENHISEVVAMTHDEDLTGQAVVKFIRENGGTRNEANRKAESGKRK